jgi:aerotaxis receptor
VLASVGKVATIVEDIAQASSEQATGIRQVNEAVSHLDQVTQENAALVEQAAAVAASVHRDAQIMQDAVAVFQVGASMQAGQVVPLKSRAAQARQLTDDPMPGGDQEAVRWQPARVGSARR